MLSLWRNQQAIQPLDVKIEIEQRNQCAKRTKTLILAKKADAKRLLKIFDKRIASLESTIDKYQNASDLKSATYNGKQYVADYESIKTKEVEQYEREHTLYQTESIKYESELAAYLKLTSQKRGVKSQRT